MHGMGHFWGSLELNYAFRRRSGLKGDFTTLSFGGRQHKLNFV